MGNSSIGEKKASKVQKLFLVPFIHVKENKESKYEVSQMIAGKDFTYVSITPFGIISKIHSTYGITEDVLYSDMYIFTANFHTRYQMIFPKGSIQPTNKIQKELGVSGYEHLITNFKEFKSYYNVVWNTEVGRGDMDSIWYMRKLLLAILRHKQYFSEEYINIVLQEMTNINEIKKYIPKKKEHSSIFTNRPNLIDILPNEKLELWKYIEKHAIDTLNRIENEN